MPNPARSLKLLVILALSAALAVSLTSKTTSASAANPAYVFVLDTSINARPTLAPATQSLCNALWKLNAVCNFQVITVSNNNATPLDKKLLRASKQTVGRAEDWLDTLTAKGEFDPNAAIEQAYDAQPDFVYLLTAGNVADPDGLMTYLKSKSRQGVKFFVIPTAPLSQEQFDSLHAIAKAGHGIVKTAIINGTEMTGPATMPATATSESTSQP